ncbi:response regulator transcription factor [Vreelandella aquamarina]|uniref:response regulator transcription factor n=1 Tax=Vreelandella aquamarina TaxID=77097 RepID=UPI00384F7680
MTNATSISSSKRHSPYLRLLVTEDHHSSVAGITDFLHMQGFPCVNVLSCDQVKAELNVDAQHILLLDINFPEITAESLIRSLRRQHGYSIGIIVLLPSDSPAERLAAWRCGADNCLVRPVNFDELDSIVWGLYQRLRQQNTGYGNPNTWMIYPDFEALTPPDGQRITLTGAETRLLVALAQKNGQIVSREALDGVLAPGGTPGDTRRLSVLISRLKKKVSTETGMTLPLQTYRNLGYAFRAEVVTPSGE